MALPPVGGGGELSPSGPKGDETMKATSKKTADAWKSAAPAQDTSRSKTIIGAHKFSNRPAEGSKAADQKTCELEPKKGLSSS